MSESDESKSKLIKTIVAVVILLVAGVALFLQFRTPPAPLAGLWYYDEDAKKLVVVPDAIPPTSFKGADAVRAYVLGCGDCKDESKLTVKYIEKFTPDAVGKLKGMGITTYAMLASEPSATQEGRLVKKPTDTEWVESSSDQGQAILNAESPKCADGNAGKPCAGPDSK